MILDYSSRKIRDVAAKSTKLEQINEIPIIQFLPKKKSGRNSNSGLYSAKTTALSLAKCQDSRKLKLCKKSCLWENFLVPDYKALSV